MSILGQFLGGPDNTVVRRRLMARQEQERKQRQMMGMRPRGGMGDYPETLPHRVMLTRSAEQMGPVTGPTIGGTDVPCAERICDLLAGMGVQIAHELRSEFIVRPREAVSFAEPSGPVSVAAGLAVAVVSVQIQEAFTGFLEKVGVDVQPGGSFGDITWQIRINGSVHPYFDNNIYAASTLANPFDFTLELPQTSTLQLVAINGGVGPLAVSGLLVGWTEFMTTFKDYGWSPSSGIG